MGEAVVIAVIGAAATVAAAWIAHRTRALKTVPEPRVGDPHPRRPRELSFKAHNARFVSADRSRGGRLVADRTSADAWEQFSLVTVGDGWFRLRASDGRFVAAGADGVLTADRDAAGAERFRFVPQGATLAALQTSAGLFVSADADQAGYLVGDRIEVRQWELFELYPTGVQSAAPGTLGEPK